MPGDRRNAHHVVRSAGLGFLLPWLQFVRVAVLFGTFIVSSACDRDEPLGSEVPKIVEAARDDDGEALPDRVEHLDLLGELPTCEVRHRGLSIDLGSEWGSAHRSFQPGPFSDVRIAMRAGHGTGEVLSNRVDYDFWLDRETTGVRVAAQAQGGRATRLAVFVDERRLGEVRLDPDESKAFEFGTVERPLPPGRHVLTLRLSGKRPNATQVLASVDWLRVYLPDNVESRYAAPTKANVLQDVELSGEPRRSLAFRSQSSVRCALLPGPKARVKVDVGYWGDGEGTVAIRAHLGHQKVVNLAERKVVGGDDAKWVPLDLSLEGVGSSLVVLELEALQTTGTGRLVFGEPRLERTLEGRPELKAQTVVVIVGSGLARDLIPPWSDRRGLNRLFDLSDRSVVFDGYRVTTTLVGGVIASLLTGETGARHGVTHTAARVADGVPLMSRGLREVGGRSAFFTNVPYSFPAFGFAEDWSSFDAMSPVKDLPAEEPLRRAKAWLQAELAEDPEKKRLVVVHLRGAHPPYDLTPEEAAALPPAEYSGTLEPRRAAILLRNLRERTRESQRKLGPQDWERLLAMQRRALQKQDAALGELLALLEPEELWNRSLIVFMGDVARGDLPVIPFEPYGPLREDRASPPLMIKFPGPSGGHQRVALPVGTLDVSAAVHRALGLEVPDREPHPDLRDLAAGTAALHSFGMVAVHPPDYAFTADRYRLFGKFGETPALCEFEVDPSCQQDLQADLPFAVEWLWRMAFRGFHTQGVTRSEDTSMARVNDDTRAALTVFGL